MLLILSVAHASDPEGRTHNTNDKNGGCKCNTEEEKAPNQSLADSARGLIRDAIFRGFDSTDKPQRTCRDGRTKKWTGRVGARKDKLNKSGAAATIFDVHAQIKLE